MSIVDRINRLILARLRRRRARPSLMGDRLVEKSRSFPLTELVGVIAYEEDIYLGSVISLALAFRDGRSLNVTEEDACWDDLVAVLDRLGVTNAPSGEWLARLAAGEAGKEPIVLLDARGAPR